MFGFGFTEMAVIVLVAVMLFPPRELPKIARGIAKFYGQLRRTADDFRAAILEDEDLNEPIRDIRNVYNEARYEVQRTHEMTQREIAKARMEARMAARKVADSVDPRKVGKELGATTKNGGKSGGKSGSKSSSSGKAVAAPAANEASRGGDERTDSDGDAARATDVTAGTAGDAGTGHEAMEPAAPKARERLVSATAGSNRPEDAPPSPIRPPRSKLSVPPGLESKAPVPSAPPVPGVVPGRVARGASADGDATSSPAESEGSDPTDGENSKGVA